MLKFLNLTKVGIKNNISMIYSNIFEKIYDSVAVTHKKVLPKSISNTSIY